MNLKTRTSRLEQEANASQDGRDNPVSNECICYPDLPFGFALKKDEERSAEEGPCPMQGNWIANYLRVAYRSNWMADDETHPWWETQDLQYKKAVLGTRCFLKGGA